MLKALCSKGHTLALAQTLCSKVHKCETWRSLQAVCVMLVVGHLISTISFALIMEMEWTSRLCAHALVGQCPERDVCMFAAMGA